MSDREILEKIIKQKGRCALIQCVDDNCPFWDCTNSTCKKDRLNHEHAVLQCEKKLAEMDEGEISDWEVHSNHSTYTIAPKREPSSFIFQSEEHKRKLEIKSNGEVIVTGEWEDAAKAFFEQLSKYGIGYYEENKRLKRQIELLEGLAANLVSVSRRGM